MPYAPVPGIYNSRNSNNIASLILRQGDVAAEGARRSGEIWGNFANQMGQIASGAYTAIRQEKDQKKREEMFNSALQSWDPADPMKTYRGLAVVMGPKDAFSAVTALGALSKPPQQMTPEDAQKVLGGYGSLRRSMGDEYMAKSWETLKQHAAPAAAVLGIPVPDQYTPEIGKALETYAPGAKQEGFTLSPGQTRYGPEGQPVATAPGAEPKTPNLQHIETAEGIRTFNPQTGEVGPVIAHGKPPASLVVNPGKEADIKENAGQIVDGNLLPSQLSKRSGDFNHLLAEANRISKDRTGKPISFTKLQLDYEGAKRFVGNMNSSQMIRFKGLAGSVVNTIDEVRALAEELKQGGVQRWNQAKRDTILQVYGNTPLSETAARYISAVNTLKEEFANLAQGGYAPTEAAWKLADQQINGNYGVKDFNASLVEAQRLINYRLGAFDELGPSLLGGGGQGFVQAETAGKAGGIPSPKSKAEYDALPPGTKYMHPDGTMKVKGQ